MSGPNQAGAIPMVAPERSVSGSGPKISPLAAGVVGGGSALAVAARHAVRAGAEATAQRAAQRAVAMQPLAQMGDVLTGRGVQPFIQRMGAGMTRFGATYFGDLSGIGAGARAGGTLGAALEGGEVGAEAGTVLGGPVGTVVGGALAAALAAAGAAAFANGQSSSERDFADASTNAVESNYWRQPTFNPLLHPIMWNQQAQQRQDRWRAEHPHKGTPYTSGWFGEGPW
jgi:hypothetical protein